MRRDEADLDVAQRVVCTWLRMRLEEAADALVWEMFDLVERPRTTNVQARITATIGRVPGTPHDRHWRIINAACHAYGRLCDVLHGRSAWMRVPDTQLETWAAAVDDYESLAVELGFHRHTGT